MAEIEATLTASALQLLGSFLNGDVGANLFKVAEFRVGEGGWENGPGGIVPRTPDPTLTGLDAVINPGRYPADSQATFTKALTSGVDTGLVVTTSLITFSATCVLLTGEFNDDGFGNFPEIYEIGLFGPHPITLTTFMIAYGTFQRQEKTPAGTLTNVVNVKFQLG